MTHVNKINKQNGFTLIELLMSMSFVAVLLISIAMLVIQIGNIYNRGLTIKDVNQAGRSLSSDLQSSIAQSPQFSVVANTGGRYVTQTNTSGRLVGGRLCLGSYSYVWNDGISFLTGGNPPNKYTGSDASIAIRFVKVVDSNANYCTQTSPGVYPAVAKNDSTELLNVGELNLSVYNFSITSNDKVSDDKTGQRLYNISFLLGTSIKAIDNATMGCRPPNFVGPDSDHTSDINYCSINQFNIVAHAGNLIE